MNTRLTTAAAVIAFAFAATLPAIAAAQDAKGSPPPSAYPPSGMATAQQNGMHEMPATVTNVDHKTGVVEVESMNMNLKLHFPANSVAELKKGDKITVHMGFTKQG